MLEFRLPRLGKGNHSSTILRWLVKPGDQVTDGQPMLEVETEKVRTEIPAPATGTVVEIRGQAGTTLRVYEVLALLVSEDEASERASTPAESPEQQTRYAG